MISTIEAKRIKSKKEMEAVSALSEISNAKEEASAASEGGNSAFAERASKLTPGPSKPKPRSSTQISPNIKLQPENEPENQNHVPQCKVPSKSAATFRERSILSFSRSSGQNKPSKIKTPSVTVTEH